MPSGSWATRSPASGVYDVHEYRAEKAAALAKLTALIERIIHPGPARVVNLR